MEAAVLSNLFDLSAEHGDTSSNAAPVHFQFCFAGSASAGLRRMNAAGTSLRAMMLLGLNAGFGNNDCASLPISTIDLDGGWIDFPRPKTGIARRCHLWPETRQAIREVLAERPAPKDPADAGLVFLQRSGRRWVRNTPNSRTDNISVQFFFLLKAQAMYREGIGFYTLRHVFRTIADAAIVIRKEDHSGNRLLRVRIHHHLSVIRHAYGNRYGKVSHSAIEQKFLVLAAHGYRFRIGLARGIVAAGLALDRQRRQRAWLNVDIAPLQCAGQLVGV